MTGDAGLVAREAGVGGRRPEAAPFFLEFEAENAYGTGA